MPPSPLTATFLQSTVLHAISNILAQLIDQYRNNTPYVINPLALLQFCIYAILSVPPNFYWQRYVEARYPGFPSWTSIKKYASRRKASSASDPEELLPRKEKPARQSPPSSGVGNFAIKFLLDQTVAAVMNITLFIVLIYALKGEALQRVWELLCEHLVPLMIARLKYRPIVSSLLYTVVPVDRRVVFGSACGVIWGVYLSLYAGF